MFLGPLLFARMIKDKMTTYKNKTDSHVLEAVILSPLLKIYHVKPGINYLLTAIFLLMGILNPVNNNSVDLSIGFFTFGFASFLILDFKFKPWSVILFSVSGSMIFWLIKDFNYLTFLSSTCGILAAFLINRFRLVNFAIWVLIISFLLASWFTSKNLRTILDSDLSGYAYNNDPGTFLKTYFLIERNVNYYDAYQQAFLGRFGSSIIPSDIWGWRLPTSFMLWKFLPGSSALSIYYLYLMLAASVLYVSFKIGSHYLGSISGLLSSYLIFPYLHYGARDIMFLITEWWSISFFILGIYFLIYRKLFLAILLFSLTLMTREIYILPLGLMFIYAFLLKRRIVPVFAIPIAAFSLLFFYHISRVNLYIDAWQTLFTPRTVTDGLFFIQQTLAFASGEYLFYYFRPFSIFLLFAIVGSLILTRMRGFRENGVIWILAYLPFPVSYLRFGTLPFNDYWGIMYVPLVIILTPVSLMFFENRRLGKDSTQGD
ncbi:hypothetical protein A2305_01065 [Candidatus Curtissbacteria bacterium RIFOXYB2_FULL_41_10]|nr:MAG: hypothetical protein A2305_01065 [Candidatus Curtissbacteria bacterium RIFOXYB2_FULL_41_10]